MDDKTTLEGSVTEQGGEVPDEEFADEELKAGEKRDIVDMKLVWEDKMNQVIYADKQGYFVYNEADD